MPPHNSHPVTLETLNGYMQKIAYPEMEEIVDKKMKRYTNEILNSNDRLAKKLDRILTEQQAITVNYKRLDQKVENLESFAEAVARALQIKFERA